MKDSKKIKYNLIIGILGQVAALLLGVMVPKFILNGFGSEINGLLSSITNIYSYIALIEMGVAAAACQVLYKPIASGDRLRINAIMSATHVYYKRTGKIYLLVVVAFAAIYPLIIRTDLPYSVIVWVILFNGLGNVINYFFYGKYMLLLKADGKQYVRTGIEMLINAFKQIMKIVLIFNGYNVLAVQFVTMCASLLQMMCIHGYMHKHYSWLDLTVEPEMSALSNSKHVLAHEINYLVTSNVDIVLLSVFNTLKTVSVYSIYAMLFAMLSKGLRIIKDSLEFKIAHQFNRNKESFLIMFEAYEAYYTVFAFSLFTTANFLILPFLKLYTVGVTDANYLDAYLPYLFVLINLLQTGKYPAEAMVHISGCFEETKRSAYVETVINLVISVVLIQFMGMYGVLIGTVISLLYRANYLIVYINRNVIKRGSAKTYVCWLSCFAIYGIIMFVSSKFQVKCDSYLELMVVCVIYSLIVMLMYFGVVSAMRPKSFLYIIKGICARKSLLEK